MLPLGTLASSRVAASGVIVAGAAAWWKADSLSLSDGDPVATWADSTGNGFDATQATSGYRPTYETGVRNGLPVVRFAGSDAAKHHLESGVSASSAAVTLHAVVYHASIANNFGTPIASTSTGAWQIDLSNGSGLRLLRQYAANVGSSGADTTPLSTWYILTARYGSSAWKLRVNGTSHSGSGSHTPSASRTVVMGRNPGAGAPTAGLSNDWFGGDIGEVIVYHSALSDADIAANEAYLTTKWGF
jgi:hypothetical protein